MTEPRDQDEIVDPDADAESAMEAGDPSPARPVSQRAAFAAIVGGLAGWAAAGTVGFVAGLVAGVLVVVAPVALLGLAVVAPGVLAVMTLTEADLDERSIRIFSALRPRTHDAGLVMVVIWVAAGVVVWRRAVPDRTVFEPDRAVRRRWVLVVVLVLAIVATAMAID